MNLCYLGDAFDHWKGSLFESLQQAELLNGFAVDPMATDSREWQTDDYELFARLLRIRRDQFVSHRCSLAADRVGYFQEIEHSGDLFLDPDIGVATSNVRDISKYIRPGEVRSLLGYRPNRVIVVYQHVRGQRTHDRIQTVVANLMPNDQAFACCSYESGTVAMLFFSRDFERVRDIHRHYEELLGRHADRRVYCWPAN